MSRAAIALATLLSFSSTAAHENASTAHYLANAGVVVTHGETQVAFDPLFRNTFDRYDPVPDALESALVSGEPPFDSIDAVFISHYHSDHFDPALILAWAETKTTLDVYAPTQAVDGILAVRTPAESVQQRIHAIAMQPGDAPREIVSGELVIEVIRIPHAGWPNRMTDVENLSFRVTLSGATTVVHLGDADDKRVHFDKQADHWAARDSDLAMPPFWFFLHDEGRQIVDETLEAVLTIGVHAPATLPDSAADREARFDGRDVFTRPGETRDIPPR